MLFSVSILGSSSALPTSKRFPTAHLLQVDERFFLIDCGEGTQIQLRKFKAKLGKINNVFISHLHGDHVLGIFGLISSLNLLGRKHDLNIYAHGDLNEIMHNHLKFFGQGIEFNINIHNLPGRKKKVIYEDEKISVLSFPLKHRIATSGFLFREKKKALNIRKEMIHKYQLSIKDIHLIKNGRDYTTDDGNVIPNQELTLPPFVPRTYAFCSDTKYTESIVPVIQNVDLLYHEATFLHKDLQRARETYHSTARQAAQIAQKAGVKKLIIGHFSARYKDESILLNEARGVFENTHMVNDGDCFNIPLERKHLTN